MIAPILFIKPQICIHLFCVLFISVIMQIMVKQSVYFILSFYFYQTFNDTYTLDLLRKCKVGTILLAVCTIFFLKTCMNVVQLILYKLQRSLMKLLVHEHVKKAIRLKEFKKSEIPPYPLIAINLVGKCRYLKNLTALSNSS